VFRRAQGLFYDASTLGSLSVFLLVMITSAGLRGPECGLGLKRGWLIAAAMAPAAALLFSFSRAAVISLAVSLAALGWLERGRLRIRWRTIAGTALAAAAALAALYRLLPESVAFYAERLRASGEFLFSAPNMILSQRLESWRMLLGYLADNPWRMLLGIGYKSLPYSDTAGRPVVADNMYLSLLVETGWLGLGALLALNAAILVTSYRRARGGGSPARRWMAAWMFCFWCGQVVQMLTGDTLTAWRVLPVYFAVLAAGSKDAGPDEDSAA